MVYQNPLGTCGQRTETCHYATLVHVNCVLRLDLAVLGLPNIKVLIDRFWCKPVKSYGFLAFSKLSR
jgi:hypothetical protein